MRTLPHAALAAIACMTAAALSGAATAGLHPEVPAATVQEIDPAKLYAEHCARCHGADGDGKGSAELERPARSFLDGGYSYGNTEDAVRRSIRHGIPGTPMPAFPDLDVLEIGALARHVIDLGPEGTVTVPGASVMTVGTRPVVVHGMMPALEEGSRREPRSVVIGFPNGATFQYRKRSAELLATFVGDFLDRADWGGRGGAALRPLGTLNWSAEPEGTAVGSIVRDGAPLTRTLRTVTIVGEASVRVDFDLVSRAGERAPGGQEFISFIDVEGVPVALRSILVAGTGASFVAPTAEPIATLKSDGVPTLNARPAGAGLFVCDLEGLDTVRLFVHSAAWSSALETALTASLTAPKTEATR